MLHLDNFIGVIYNGIGIIFGWGVSDKGHKLTILFEAAIGGAVGHGNGVIPIGSMEGIFTYMNGWFSLKFIFVPGALQRVPNGW